MARFSSTFGFALLAVACGAPSEDVERDTQELPSGTGASTSGSGAGEGLIMADGSGTSGSGTVTPSVPDATTSTGGSTSVEDPQGMNPTDGTGATTGGDCSSCRTWDSYMFWNPETMAEDLPQIGDCVTGADGVNYRLSEQAETYDGTCGPSPMERESFCDDSLKNNFQFCN